VSQTSSQNLYVGSLIVSVLGGIAVLSGDFGGTFYGGSVLSWYYIGLYAETPIVSAIIVFVALSLFYVTYVSLLGLNPSFVQSSQSDLLTFTPGKLKLGLILAVASLIVVSIAAVVFILSVLTDEPDDWWLDVGFYGGIIGSGLSSLFLYMVYKE